MRYRIPNFTDRAPRTAPPSLVHLGEGKGIVNEGGKKKKGKYPAHKRICVDPQQERLWFVIAFIYGHLELMSRIILTHSGTTPDSPKSLLLCFSHKPGAWRARERDGLAEPRVQLLLGVAGKPIWAVANPSLGAFWWGEATRGSCRKGV